MATGLTRYYVPDIPGIELCENYGDHSVNPEDYLNKRVLIVGKGNSGFETANNITETAAVIHICSPESVEFAWQTHYVGHLRAVNNHFLDTYHLKSQNAVLDATINKIERNNGMCKVYITYSHAKEQTRVFSYDNVIVCTGFGSNNSIFDESCSPEMTIYDLLPAQTTEWESVNVKDMYFAGTIMAACDFKKTMSGFIHGFRHNIQALSNLFEQKYHGKPWPYNKLPAASGKILDKVVKRINTAPGMFLQPGFIGDVMVVSRENGSAEYYEDIRLDYVGDSQFGNNNHYYTISLEYENPLVIHSALSVILILPKVRMHHICIQSFAVTISAIWWQNIIFKMIWRANGSKTFISNPLWPF